MSELTTINTSSFEQINPQSLVETEIGGQDSKLIKLSTKDGEFDSIENFIEYFIYDYNKSLVKKDYDFKEYNISVPNNELEINPITDCIGKNIDRGTVFSTYNFLNNELNTSRQPRKFYFISKISSDRTELKLESNTLPTLSPTKFNEFYNRVIHNNPLTPTNTFNPSESPSDDPSTSNNASRDEFYLNFGDNKLVIGVNIEQQDQGKSLIIKLYKPLPIDINLKSETTIVTKVAETKTFKVDLVNSPIQLEDDVTYLRGPNTNLRTKDFINNSTILQSNEELLATSVTGSENQLKNLLNKKGITITPNYSYNTFDEFVNFSSAKSRINNFYNKASDIQSYQEDIITLNTITGSTTGSSQFSSSVASLETKIENIITNFDGYEYYLYFNNSSYAYPKSGSIFPYTLKSTGSTDVLNWLGSDVEGSTYYGGIILSASRYDSSNSNWLYYTIPEFIRENGDNEDYLEFSNMVGQHFDELWLYTKTVTEKLNTTNELDKGIPLDFTTDMLKSLGYPEFGNNYNTQDLHTGLIGMSPEGSFHPPTGSELINNYIAINGGGDVINYWSLDYSLLYYVEQLLDGGWPYAIDRVSKEIFKRLYHNLAYLVKKKGTISGLRQLINIWGIPNTILRINEFGGKNKDNSDDYDLWYERYSYAYTPVANTHVASSSVLFPWMPLERNRVADSKLIVPDSFQFRFKTTGIPSSSYAGGFYSQSLAVKKSDGDFTSTDFDFGIMLSYEEPTTASYSGSFNIEYDDYGKIKFYISGSSANGGVAVSNEIYLPFFNKGWWSVMLQRNQHVSASIHNTATTYTLYAKNNLYNGNDGNQIGFEGSASIVSNISTSINESWNKFGTGSYDGIYLGGFISGSNVGGFTLNESGKIFSGSLQEFRYYNNDISEAVFNDFVMNPESIEGNNLTGSESSFDIVSFRAPLGNEMEHIFTSSISSSYTESINSLHPAYTPDISLYMTGSFVNPTTLATSSNYTIFYLENTTTRTYSKTNTETYFLDQPTVGLRNRVSNKVRVEDGNTYGSILSRNTSIQQDYQVSRSYTEDVRQLEVAFSPQDEINDDIIQTFGFGVVSDTLADGRFISSSLNYYPELRDVAKDYFKKYTKGNIYDYMRLIKYVDNSLFKAIENYVPAGTSLSTGIVVKQHLLERNRNRVPQLNQNTTVAITPSGSFNTPIILQNLELSSSITIVDGESPTGSTGGSLNTFNYSGTASFGETPITQSWVNKRETIAGAILVDEDTQKEFYDGEFSGSNFPVVTQSLNPNNTYLASNSTITYKSSYLYKVEAKNAAGTKNKFFTIGDTATIVGSEGTITATVKDAYSVNKDTSHQVVILDNLSNNFPITSSGYTPGKSISVTAGEGNGLLNDFMSWGFIGDELFDFSDDNVVMNNVEDSRLNSYLMDVDYSRGILTPLNSASIKAGTATKAQVPDSNYTMKDYILPRYDGSKVKSVDYNNYTNTTSSLTFINGDTGSWDGDDSYGKTSTINKHPKYIARFKNSRESREFFNTTTYDIDQLIVIPETPVSPDYMPFTKTVKSQNINLSDIFEITRKVSIEYDNNDVGGIYYGQISEEPRDILQGSSEYEVIYTNQPEYGSYVTQSVFNNTNWCNAYQGNSSEEFQPWINGRVANSYNISESINDGFLITGSNKFILTGSQISEYQVPTGSTWALRGDTLSILHHLNYIVANGLTGSGTPWNVQVLPNNLDANNPNNYFDINLLSSQTPDYKNFSQPFLIKRGDEIRIQYREENGYLKESSFVVTNIAESSVSILTRKSSPNTPDEEDLPENNPV